MVSAYHSGLFGFRSYAIEFGIIAAMATVAFVTTLPALG
jgi:hypothetical protein